MKAAVARALAACAAILACACGRNREPTPSAAAKLATAEGIDAGASPEHGVVLDWAQSLDRCAFGHHGVLLDFGDAAMTAEGRALPSVGSRPARDEIVEHEGATWLRAHSRVVTASFYWPAGIEGSEGSVYAEARIRGLLAHSVAFAIDGKPLGSATLTRGDARIVVARGSSATLLAAGGHELALHFVGGPRTGDDALAEIDWVHVGSGEPVEPYAAPTREDVVLDATVGGRSMRTLAVRAPGFVRCSGWIPANATLEASLATAGGGDAEVEARLVRDRRQPVVLGTATIVGGAAAWAPWSVPVTGLEGDGALASVEIIVRRAPKGTRAWLGAPRVVAAGPVATSAAPVARGVVLVVLGATPAKVLAPWGGAHAAPELSSLAASGTTFLTNRASSSLANSVVATMLSGLSSRAHGLDDPDARLPGDVVMVQEACRQGGVSTAMFTANPTTGAAFGFARGWDTFVERDPLDDGPSTRVFDDAATWIDAHKKERFFVVIHARGGHPPWEATPEELRAMPPDGYFGMIEPRRAAEAMSKARKHPGRFKEDDRIRAWALFDRAIDDHDAALGRLTAALRAADREGDVAVLVSGDVAASEAAQVPFGDPDTLDESLLSTPLVVRWPGGAAHPGERIAAPTGPADIARTTLDLLALTPPSAFGGQDLATVGHGGQGAAVPAERPLLASRGARFSVRWGPYVLVGARGRELRMCDLSLDPSCVADVRGTSPLALESIRRFTYDALAPATRATREPATIDEHTAAALVRWGRTTDERENDDEF